MGNWSVVWLGTSESTEHATELSHLRDNLSQFLLLKIPFTDPGLLPGASALSTCLPLTLALRESPQVEHHKYSQEGIVSMASRMALPRGWGGTPTALPSLNQQRVFTAAYLLEWVLKPLDSSVQGVANESVSQTITIHKEEFVNQPPASFIEKVLL